VIDQPGVYELPHEDYHRDPCPEPSLSASSIKKIVTHSPRHAWTGSQRLNPDYVSEEKMEFDRGSAAHALLLEGDDRMAVLPFPDYKKDAAKASRADARAAGRFPILEQQYPSILKMREIALRAIAACPDLGGIRLTDGKAEQSLFWKEGDVWNRARTDWMHKDRGLILDYKSTATCAHPDAWVRTMAGMGGEIQGAHYLRGNEMTGGDPLGKFVFLVQEVVDPFACCLIGLPPAFLELGAAKRFEALRVWHHCLKTGVWPSYPDRICWVEPPPYLIAQWEGRGIGADPGTAIDENAEFQPGELERLGRIGRRAA
jgi:hypothetical protein